MSTTADSGLTVDQLDHHGKTSHEVYTAGFCQPLARELTEQRMLDWMDEQIR